MAGYYLYSIGGRVFHQLTTSPTKKQGLALADGILEDFDDLADEFGDPAEADRWPQERGALADVIVQRLAAADWYSDLSADGAQLWDHVVFSLQDEPGMRIGIDFQCYDYESIYWDCAEIAAAHGAPMMEEPGFGGSGFRYFGKPKSDFWPMYSLLLPEQSQQLLTQLKAAEPHFASLADEDEGSPREQFFEGLLPPVQHVVQTGRVLWVQTDT